MKFKGWLITMIIGMFVTTLIPAHSVFAEEANEKVEINIKSMEQESHNAIGEGEPEVTIPATENEYLISEDCQVLNDVMNSRTILSTIVSFARSSQTVGKASVAITGNSKTTKLESTIYLMRKDGSTYEYIGKKSTKSASAASILHNASFSVEKGKDYQIKVMITEYRGSTKYTKPAIYKKLS